MYFVFTTEIARTNKNLSCGRELDTKKQNIKIKIKKSKQKRIKKKKQS